MITEVSSQSDPPLPTVAFEAVQSVTSHYSQDVHLSSNDAAHGDVGSAGLTSRKDNGRGGRIRIGRPSTQSKVVKHWSEKLQSAAVLSTSTDKDITGTSTSTAAAVAAAAVLSLYPRLVRETIVSRQSRPVLPASTDEDDDDDFGSTERIEVGRCGHVTSRYYCELIGDLLAKGGVEHGDDDDDNDDGDATNVSSALARTSLGGTRSSASEPLTTSDFDANSIYLAVVALAEDVVSLTAAPSILTTDEEKMTASTIAEADRVRRVTMPHLLDAISIGIDLARDLDPAAFVDVREIGGTARDAIMAATIAAASFTSGVDLVGSANRCDDAVDPACIHPALKSKLSLSYALRHTLSDPQRNGSVSSDAGTDALMKSCFGDDFEKNSSLFDEAIVDLSSRCVPSPWSKAEGERDDEKSPVEASAERVLSTILTVLRKNNDDDDESKPMNRTVLDIIVICLGGQYVSGAARSHFFGRGLPSSTMSIRKTTSIVTTNVSANNDSTAEKRSPVDSVTDSIVARNVSSTQLPWPKSSRSKKNTSAARTNATILPKSRAHVTIPSRLCSAVRLCAAIGNCGARVKGKGSRTILANLLPITYSLIDSISATEQAIGGSVILSLLLSYDAEHWANFASAAGDVLGLAIKTGCSDAVALAAMCRARYELELIHQNVLEIKDDGEKAGRLRKIAMSMLEVVHKSSYKSGIEEEGSSGYGGPQGAFVMSALLGGVHPLLSQLADMPDEVAASVELVRPGLATLLPLIGWDVPMMQVRSRKLQLSALACLEELMVGGHPVVPRHGGKIISELLGCICRARNDIGIVEKELAGRKGEAGNNCTQVAVAGAVASLGLRVARIALILCGERAKAVLEMVESRDNGYDTDLVLICKDVQQ